MNRRFGYAVATLVGSTVGVGIYGIPFAFAKAGFGLGLLFLLGIAGLMLLSNLLYGEIILRTHQRHHFIGYTNKYLGAVVRKINLFTFMLGAFGALIGIIIISGNFLSNALSFLWYLSPAGYSTFFVAVAAVLIFMGRRTVSKLDFFMMFIFSGVVLLIGVIGIKQINLANYALSTGGYWFLPFGVIMFSMAGRSGVPLAREVLVGGENKLKKTLMIGTIIPAVIYFVFALIVVGVSGDATSPDGISGLLSDLGPKIVLIGSLLGFMTSATIFLNLATALKESFQQDFRFRHRWAWLLTMVPPYVLFLSGVRNFIDIIGLVGGLAVSIEMIILIFLYVKTKKAGDRIPEYSIRVPVPVLYLIMLVFAAAAVYTIIIK